MNDSLGALLAIVFIWLVVKFAYGGSSPPSSDPTAGPPVTEGPGLGLARNRPVSQETVDSLTAMFPHIPEAAIRYDLQRSGSADITCERILTEGRLPDPPAGLFPPTTATATTARTNPANRSSSTTNGNGTNNPPTNSILSTPNSKASTSKKSPSLISRFGLESRLNEESDSDSSLGNISTESLKGKERATASSGWGEEKSEREKKLRERKERMILEARKRMQEKTKNSPSSTSP